jgi:LuxR family maltose regulon positive regulatory protein
MDEVKAFLLETSVLDRLCGSLGDALVAGTADGKTPGHSQEILEYLEQANLFLVPLDNKRQWFRYHHLFADLLRHRLSQVYPERIAGLHHRAAIWYESQGVIREAVQHALADPDPSYAVELVGRYAIPMIYQSQTRTVLGWFRTLPDDTICSQPMLCVTYAWALALADQGGPHDAVERRLQAAETALSAPGTDSAFRDLVAGHVASVRAYLIESSARPDYDPHRVIALASEAQRLLPEDEMAIRSVNALGIAGAYLFLGDTVAAYTAYGKTRHMAEAGGNY